MRSLSPRITDGDIPRLHTHTVSIALPEKRVVSQDGRALHQALSQCRQRQLFLERKQTRHWELLSVSSERTKSKTWKATIWKQPWNIWLQNMFKPKELIRVRLNRWTEKTWAVKVSMCYSGNSLTSAFQRYSGITGRKNTDCFIIMFTKVWAMHSFPPNTIFLKSTYPIF